MINILGNVKKITSTEVNLQPWKLEEYIGLKFEKHVHRVVAHALQPYYENGLKLTKTEPTRDDGRDLVIESEVKFSLFGHRFKENSKIYIECKSSSQKRISFEKFAKNLIIDDKEVNYLILITNATITPHAYHEACRMAKDNNYEFILVDQYLLAIFFEENSAMIGEYKPPEISPRIEGEYQIRKSHLQGKPSYDIFIRLTNYTETPAGYSFYLKSDRNWLVDANRHDGILDSNSSCLQKVVMQKEYFDGIDDILLKFQLNAMSCTIKIEGKDLSYDFETPLTGGQHKKYIAATVDSISSNKNMSFFMIHGEAGIGKTRIIDEILKQLINRNFIIIHHLCTEKGKDENVSSLISSLEKESNCIDNRNLVELIDKISEPFVKYLVVLEDFHNSEKRLYDELVALIESKSLNPNINISFILAGRNDYTVYNENFFNFLEYIKLKKNMDTRLKEIVLGPLTKDECKLLIKLIINEVPEEVCNRIQALSKNIPFYIVQFIEYLLEVKLVNLINRNTVGIPNIYTFSKNLYIPEKIEELIEKREDNLRNQVFGEKLNDFLMICGYIGIEISETYFSQFFSEEEQLYTDILFTKHFLRFTHNGKISFDHESIYMYFKKRAGDNLKYISNIFQNNKDLLDILDALKRAKIYYYLKDFKTSYKLFKEPIDELKKINNISSEKLTVSYYEYYIEIYLLLQKMNLIELSEKALLAMIYIAMHCLSYGKAEEAFHKVFSFMTKKHKNNKLLYTKINQLYSHLMLHVSHLSKAQGLMIELIATERLQPDLFDEETRFNLFERAASLYIHYNYKNVALQYNSLANNTAKKKGDNKLLTLAKINEAKIWFFEDNEKAIDLMNQAKEYSELSPDPRIYYHNEIGLLTAKITNYYRMNKDLDCLQKQAEYLQKKAIETSYPLSVVRMHLLLGIIYYLKTANQDKKFLVDCKRQIDFGIQASIQYGISKMIANFYNMKAIISIYEGETLELINSHFNTMLHYLKQQNLLFLGNLDFCYSNFIMLTNYAKFIIEEDVESELYRFLSQLSYYNNEINCDYNCDNHKTCFYTCIKSNDVFKKHYKGLGDNEILFLREKHSFNLKDTITNMFLPIYI